MGRCGVLWELRVTTCFLLVRDLRHASLLIAKLYVFLCGLWLFATCSSLEMPPAMTTTKKLWPSILSSGTLSATLAAAATLFYLWLYLAVRYKKVAMLKVWKTSNAIPSSIRDVVKHNPSFQAWLVLRFPLLLLFAGALTFLFYYLFLALATSESKKSAGNIVVFLPIAGVATIIVSKF